MEKGSIDAEIAMNVVGVMGKNVDFKEEDNKVRFRIAAMMFAEEGF